jgi:hypothetical protein
MDLNFNDGSRNSRFALALLAVAELDEAELEHALTAEEQAWLAGVESAAADVPPLDIASLTRRTLVETLAPRPQPANRSMGALWMVAAAIVVGLVLAVWPTPPDPGLDGPQHRFRSSDTVRLHVLADGALRPWQGQKLGEGDVVGFKVQATGHQSVVVLSVDGRGDVTIFWPDPGSEAQSLSGEGWVALAGSVILDDVPGTEIFVAAFDTSPSELRDGAQRAWQAGGEAGVVEWAQQRADTETMVVERR